ncbi:hypothetical protein RN001_004546 [Aquatica leii]|uniref:Uncharacterized protein n=1 Tax=Aquatica leii TaxID=1421715 RepID=A0AAN7Q016_9COLE|nr:hypothetical protein RN001_004546 [Aquatica leii]
MDNNQVLCNKTEQAELCANNNSTNILNSDDSCPTETSSVQNDGDLFEVTWKSMENSYLSVAISNPPCLDENDKLVYRICLNGTWVNQNSCHYVDFNTVCPSIFYENRDKCIYVTPPQSFEEKCPYPDASTKIKGYSNIWLPIKQLVPFSAYEYVLPDEKYGLQYSSSDSSESSDEMLELTSECVVKTTKIETVPCDSKFSHVCLYKYNSFLYRCPDGCVGGGLGSDYCFCKKYKQNFSIKNLCRHFATPNYTYERNIVYELVEDDTCLLGYAPFRNFYIVMSNSNLYLKHIEEANCAICVVNSIPFEPVNMELKFNVKNSKLFLDVYSPEGLFKIDNKVQVFCFTDATNQLKKRVEVEFEFDSNSKNQNQRRFIVFKVSVSEIGPGYYWCEAFLLPHMTVIQSNKVLASKKFKYNEYSLRLQIHDLCRYSLIYCKIPNEEFISSVSKTLFDNSIFSKFIKNIRLFRVFEVNIINGTADILVHLSVKTKFSLEEEYYKINTNLKHVEKQNVTVLYFQSSSFCLPEKTFFENKTLNWQLSTIGSTVVPEEICVLENGIPVSRKCRGDFYVGSNWERITDTCYSNYSVSLKTTFLHSLVLGNSTINSTSNITTVTEDSTDLTVLDLHYISKILKQLFNSTQNNTQDSLVEIGHVFNNLMFSNNSILKNSQTLLNATDSLINIFEDSLESSIVDNDTLLLIHNNLIIHISKPFANNISGIALYGNHGSGFLNFTVKELFMNTTTAMFENETSLELAVYIPENLLNALVTNVTDLLNITVITSIYYSDNLFNTNNEMNDTLVSKVISVSIPGYGDYLTEPIPVIFKSKKNFVNRTCAFWNYGLQSQNLSGYWSTLGGEDTIGVSHEAKKSRIDTLRDPDVKWYNKVTTEESEAEDQTDESERDEIIESEHESASEQAVSSEDNTDDEINTPSECAKYYVGKDKHTKWRKQRLPM